MQLRQRHVEEERGLARVATDELAAALREHLVDAAAHFQVVAFAPFGRTALAALHDVRHFHHVGVEAHRLHEHAFVGGARDPVPLVEAAVLGVTALLVAQVPFAVHGGGVALLGEGLRQGALPGNKALRQAGRHRLHGAGAHRVAPGHERRTRGHAIAFHVEVEKLRALRGQRIDTRRGRPADGAAAIAPQLAPAKVVGQDQYHVGMLRHLRHEIPPNQSSLMFSSVTRRPSRPRPCG